MSITKYQILSDTELLAQLQTATRYSPIIDELCQRLERNIDRNICPICEANLEDFINEEQDT